MGILSDGISVNLWNSAVGQLSPPAVLLRRSRRVVAVLGFALAWRRPQRGFLVLLSRVLRPRSRRRSSLLLLCFSSHRRHCSVVLLPPLLCLHHLGKACSSSAYSLRVQLTHQFSLISPGNAVQRTSSSRPAASPSSTLRRGQSSTVRLCPC